MEKNTDDTTIKCPQCKGTGFYRVDYNLTREETHARCEDCDGKGKLETESKKKTL